MPSNTELRGAGPGRTVIGLAAGARSDMIRNADPVAGNTKSPSAISNLTATRPTTRANRSTHSGVPLAGTWDQAGVQWVRVTQSLIENCIIAGLDCAWNGIVMSGCRDVDIVRCRTDSNGNVQVGPGAWGQFEAMGILLWEGSIRSGNTAVRINSCTATEKHDIEILGPTNRDNLVSGCLAVDNNSHGISLNGAGGHHAATIIGCTCLDNCDAGIGLFTDHAIVTGNYLARNNHGMARGIWAGTDHQRCGD